ncbi:uncharacterized protein BJ171DRAFT_579697 [Polychytrium aggregatum]|uniref:uncharacterized protein n=1 Tax=Polychytrium aggregatum TaxID=110093 RepID=UPI0022FEB385|nr:uncharacterized protein BJ171DRAFT_579697 [Polychytrium aggregatum]KAI9206731.1 hypothetical protein BJ171DRAFT_579697 [Polychytrium aggregatum]
MGERLKHQGERLLAVSATAPGSAKLMSKKDRNTPAVANSATAGFINNDYWTVYISVIAGIETPDSLAPVLYDMIATGSRPKFAVIQKSTLFAWALEVGKGNDACKETKNLLDNGTPEEQIPDSLVARLLKAKLVALRQEGIEIKNGAKPLKEEDEAAPQAEAAQAAKPTQAKKDERDSGKDKDKGKAANAKKPAKGTLPCAKAEVPSRPASAQAPAEVSKRKNKLRERGVPKTDVKVAAIGDEPADGPDAYYFLRGFDTPGFLNALVEDEHVQVSTVLRLVPYLGGGTEGSQVLIEKKSHAPFDQRYLALRLACQNSSDSSLWRQIAWSDIWLNTNSEDGEIFDVIAKHLYALLDRKKAYDALYDPATMISIPQIDGTKIQQTCLRYYHHVLNAVQDEEAITSDLILAVLVENLVRVTCDGADTVPESSLPALDEVSVLQSYIERLTNKLATNDVIKDLGTVDTPTQTQPQSSKIVARYGDQYRHLVARLSTLENMGLSPRKMLEDLGSKLSICQYDRAFIQLREQYAKAFNLSEHESVLNMIGLGAALDEIGEIGAVKRMFFQTLFEKLLDFEIPLKGREWILNDWCWVEALDKPTMFQVIQEIKSIKNKLYTRYLEREGLLLIILTSPGNGELYYRNVTRSNVNTKVGFGLYNSLQESGSPLFQSITKLASKCKASGSSTYVAGDSIININETEHLAYPSKDGHIIRVRQTAFSDSLKKISLNISSEKAFVLWENITDFEAVISMTFSTGDVFSMSKSNSSNTLYVQASGQDGCIVEFLCNGNIVQKLAASSRGAAPSPLQSTDTEQGRVITPQGIVISYLGSHQAKVLFPSGNVAHERQNSWVSTNMDGAKFEASSNRAERAFRQLPSIRVIHENHINMKQRITTREDIVSKVCHDSGQVHCQHADGTEISFDGSSDNLPMTVEHPSYGVVTFKTARVRIVKLIGGLTITQSLLESGESIFEVALDNVRLTTSSDGSATYEPDFKKNSPPFKINWHKSTVDYADENAKVSITVENNELNISISSEKEMDNVHLNNYPRLFAISDDGRARQLLRDRDVLPYLQEAEVSPTSHVMESSPPGKEALRFYTIINSKGLRDACGKAGFHDNYGTVLTHRQMVRYTISNKDRENFQKIMRMQQQSLKDFTESGKLLTGPVLGGSDGSTDPRLAVLADIESQGKSKMIFGEDRLATEEEICKMFNLRRPTATAAAQYSDINILEDFSSFEEPTIRHIFKPKRIATEVNRQVVERPSGETISMSLLKTRGLRDKIREVDSIPNYFESPEGLFFLNQIKHLESHYTDAATSDPERRVYSDSVPFVLYVAHIREPTADQKEVKITPRSLSKSTSKSAPKNAQAVSQKQNLLASGHSEALEPEPLEPRFKSHTKSTGWTEKLKESGEKLALYPSRCDFGAISGRDARTATRSINIKNTGTRPIRFFIKQPKGSVVKLDYPKGPIAPGLTIRMDICLSPSPAESSGIREYSETLLIKTPEEIIQVPVTVEYVGSIGNSL